MISRTLTFLAFALALVHGQVGCTIDTRSDLYDCAGPSDCDADRLCIDGFCISSEIVGCTAPDRVNCTFSCTEAGACPDQIVCPSGYQCRVECGDDGCAGGIDCTAATSCSVACAGGAACAGPITCGAGFCTVDCSIAGACTAAIDCGQASTCDIQCRSANTCTGPIACQGSECNVTCSGSTSCTQGVDCSDACACDTNCTGIGACAVAPMCQATGNCVQNGDCRSMPANCDSC